MSNILLLSTPLNDSCSGIALLKEPKALQRITGIEKKAERIMGFHDLLWRSVGGIIWNPKTQNGVYNDKKGSNICLPDSNNRSFSFVNAQNFPNEWDIAQRKQYINAQIEKIMRYTAVNILWLPSEHRWESFWDKNNY